MDVMLKRSVRASIVGICCLLPINMAQAVTYNFPVAGAGTLAVAPQALAAGDTININSSIFEPVASNLFSYAVSLPGPSVAATTVNVAANASIIYNGTGPSPSAIVANYSDATTTLLNINNLGTISSGFGATAISLRNATTGNADIYNINNNAAIIGGIFTAGAQTVNLNLSGAADPINGVVSVLGGINLSASATSTATLNIGINGTTGSGAFTVYSTQGPISNISLIVVHPASTFVLNDPATAIAAFTVDHGSTATLNNIMSAASVNEGQISNVGTLILTSNITKTGQFNTASDGNTIVTQAISVSTSNYANAGTHTAQLTDILNYGQLNLGNITPTFVTFTATYKSGYFPAGTYNLVTSTNATSFARLPVPSLPNNPSAFITFSNLQSNDNTVQITVSRSLYQNYAKSTLTRSIAANLESIGANLPTTQNAQMVALLDAVEKSSIGGINDVMKQLAPLSTPPLHALTVQNESMKQVELRLASLRSPYKGYMAGDLVRDNQLWFRPFGAYANQKAIDDIQGYYATTGGFAMGFDRDLDSKYNVGMAASYAVSRIKDKINPNSLVLMKTYQGMLYGTYNFKTGKYLDWITGIGATNYVSNRPVNIQNFGGIANSNYSGQQFSTKATIGKDYSAFDFLQVTPEASAQYSFATQYEYQESGAQGANLDIVRKNANVVQLGVGGKLSTPILLDRSTIIPEIHLMGLFNIINGSQDTTFKFISGGDPMTSHMSLNRGTLKMGAALTLAVIGSLELKLNYDCEMQDRYVNHSGYLNFKYSL